MTDEQKESLVYIMCFLIVVCLSGGIFIGVSLDGDVKKQAIKRGCAQYSPITADFEWLGGAQ